MWLAPAEIWEKLPVTVAGVSIKVSVSVPLPTSPRTFDPQQTVVPLLVRAHVWFPPAEIWENARELLIGIGVVDLSTKLSPVPS